MKSLAQQSKVTRVRKISDSEWAAVCEIRFKNSEWDAMCKVRNCFELVRYLMDDIYALEHDIYSCEQDSIDFNAMVARRWEEAISKLRHVLVVLDANLYEQLTQEQKQEVEESFKVRGLPCWAGRLLQEARKGAAYMRMPADSPRAVKSK